MKVDLMASLFSSLNFGFQTCGSSRVSLMLVLLCLQSVGVFGEFCTEFSMRNWENY